MIKSFFNEFKKFAMRGNVMDMAVSSLVLRLEKLSILW